MATKTFKHHFITFFRQWIFLFLSGIEASSAVVSADDDDQSVNGPLVCARNGCTKSPRFDSLFCSDSCGVSALESDLLRTFQYASDIHPSMLRN